MSNNDIKIPRSRDEKANYSYEYIKKRLSFLYGQTDAQISHIPRFSESPENMIGNIENLIGCTQVPLGIAGPLKINADHAQGNFYIPLATTEGALVTSCHRGAGLISKAGGANVTVIKDSLHVAPIFIIHGLTKIKAFIQWVKKDFEHIKKRAEETTKHGKLLEIKPKITGEGVILKFSYFTQDAMGMNMIVKATDEACKYIHEQKFIPYHLRSNFSADKKISIHNIAHGYGKEVFAEVTIPKSLMSNLNITAENLDKYATRAYGSTVHAGMIGMNCHVVNMVTALFLACGQDIAHAIHSTTAVSSYKSINDGDLNVSVTIPNLLVGTVGGGTNLSTQNECMEIMGCRGKNKALKFAEIVAASALAGEISIVISLLNDTFVVAHELLGRNKP